jgi:hypothetical protein
MYSVSGVALIHRFGLTDEQSDRHWKRMQSLNLARFIQHGYYGPWWTAKELKLLGKLPDAEVAARIGRSVGAVRRMRTRLGMPTAADRWQRRLLLLLPIVGDAGRLHFPW